jgi:hypothetical protein
MGTDTSVAPAADVVAVAGFKVSRLHSGGGTVGRSTNYTVARCKGVDGGHAKTGIAAAALRRVSVDRATVSPLNLAAARLRYIVGNIRLSSDAVNSLTRSQN